MNKLTKHWFSVIVPPLMTAGLVIVAVLTAMNSSAGIQGSGHRNLLAIGTVTGSGGHNSSSIVVDGTSYSTSGTVFLVDGHPGSAGQIQAGDVVSVTATESADGGPAAASRVTFNGSVQGEVSSIDAPSSRLFVMGQTVHVDSQTTFGSNVKPAGLVGLQKGDAVEVSGFANSVGEWVATRIELKGQGNVSRVVGTVQTLDQTRRTFYINSLKVDYGNAEVEAVLTASVPVMAQGVKFAADGALIANLVRAPGPAHGQSAGSIGRIQGLITSYPSSAYFEVDAQPVAISAQTKLSFPVPIGLDVEVHVSGTFDTSGVLLADTVQTSK